MTNKQKWITTETEKNPFVKLPKSKAGAKLYYNEEVFLALSGMIQQVGKWKDEGLFYEYMDVIEQSKSKSNNHQSEILKKMNDLLKKYRSENLFLKKIVYFC